MSVLLSMLTDSGVGPPYTERKVVIWSAISFQHTTYGRLRSYIDGAYVRNALFKLSVRTFQHDYIHVYELTDLIHWVAFKKKNYHSSLNFNIKHYILYLTNISVFQLE